MTETNPLCSMRAYLKAGSLQSEGGLWRKLTTPAHHQLAERALKAGLLHVSFTFGSVGFAPGATSVSAEHPELPMDGLPLCVELVGSREKLDHFVEQNARDFADAVILVVHGVEFQRRAGSATR